MRKGKIQSEDSGKNKITLDKIADEFKGEKFSLIDGMRIDFVKHYDFKDGWVHLRSSNTEPIFRIITEGKDEKQASLIYNFFVKKFGK